MEGSGDEAVRAECAYDSDEERREAHAEEVNERRLALECGELDEGQDDFNEEELRVWCRGDSGWSDWIEYYHPCEDEPQESVDNPDPLYSHVKGHTLPELRQIASEHEICLNGANEVTHDIGSVRCSIEELCDRDKLFASALDAAIIPAGKFRYVNCLYDDSGDTLEYDDTRKCIRSVTFNISRYGEHTETIEFGRPVTEKEAVEAAEEWLSVELTRKYYYVVREDLFNPDMQWDRAQEVFKTRGDLLGDCIFLESIDIDDNCNATISCGS